MAGNHNSGRRPIPTAALVRSGRYENSRHGDRADILYSGVPAMPAGLGVDGEKLWAMLVENTPDGVLVGVDSALMAGMCRWWSIWKDADAEVAENPCRNTIITAGHAWTHFSKLAAEFGMGPISRTRIKAPNAGGEESDPILALFGGNQEETA